MIDFVFLAQETVEQVQSQPTVDWQIGGIVISIITTIGVVATAYITSKNSKKLEEVSNNNTRDHGKVVEELYSLKVSVDEAKGQLGAVSEEVRALAAKIANVDTGVEAIIQSADYAVFHSTQEGKLISANDAAVELLGIGYDEMTDPKKWIEAVHPDDRDKVADNWARVMKNQKAEPAISYRYLHRRTGRIIPVVASVSPIRNAEGAIVEWLSVVVKDGSEASKK